MAKTGETYECKECKRKLSIDNDADKAMAADLCPDCYAKQEMVKVRVEHQVKAELLWMAVDDVLPHIDYWCDVIHYQADHSLTIKEHEGDEESIILTTGVLGDGLQRMLESSNSNIRRMGMDFIDDDYDAESADVLIQMAALKEVVYG